MNLNVTARSQIHERTISVRFKAVILRVLRLAFMYGFHTPLGWFSFRFSPFLLYRNCKRLREFEEIEYQGKAVEVTVNGKEEKLFRLLSGFRPRIRSQ